MIQMLVILALIPVNIFIFIKIGKMMFEDMDDFWDCVKHDLTPDIYSLFKGRLLKDWHGEFRLSLFGLACGLVVLVEFLMFQGFF
ncbi:hypothetical protein EJF36_03360 [Bacillus sp. HMF5848]|uniref:hypothetical protein n=1 Tax=Bacillus sp. HMF5848 TaxID=2495421 RepID=UPI000F7B6A2A|nr:hypothetical protein [Bacillus sp. HMF5848]RSK26012.1 hypothetical protein EJF36_03360 [Bacillus sp. HMF5848]